jgi:hypothetical protein
MFGDLNQRKDLMKGNDANILQIQKTVTVRKSSLKFLKEKPSFTQTSVEHLKP